MAKGKTDLVLVLLLLAAIGIMTGYIKLGGMEGVKQAAGSFGQLVTLSVRGVDKYTGNAVNVNAELWSSDNTQVVSETNVNQALTSLSSSLPNSFDGFVMLGNDDYQSTTDRGTEYYYVKYPVSWSNIQGLVAKDTIYTYAEETPTGSSLWTFYDDGTKETTPNITIGSGGTYTAASVKMMSSSNRCFGNPSLKGMKPRIVGWCFNESTAGMFKEIKPLKNSGTFAVPEFLKGKNVVDCYYVHDDLCDGAYFETDLYIEANAGQDPTTSDYIGIIPVDLAWVKNDQGKWVVAFGDDSDLTSDTDAGIDSISAALIIHTA